ncbi:hypothetical protein B9Z65_5552 [Elsinoe australis]|uniref:Zn(2)-C6 fungal-type domain-containing protein n=1 Tax=Elsinoe australis TaxID=40998 RepID=A0A2P7ZED8_9PEZI|nr:hypothetical protein B9Z65_5552 [Elsinoe australis]
MQVPASGAGESEHPACSACRKRKLRCSRDVPTCANCRKTGVECVYFLKRKPGVRVGAIESLSRRLSLLEGLLLDENGTPFIDPSSIAKDGRASASLTHQTPTLATSTSSVDYATPNLTSTESGDDEPQHASTVASAEHGYQHDQARQVRTHRTEPSPIRGVKRKASDVEHVATDHSSHATYMPSALPAREIVIELVDYFCLSFHHWIPFVNKPRLRANVRKDIWSPALHHLLHAIVAGCLPHVDASAFELRGNVQDVIEQCRSMVLQRAIAELSVESLQSLVIIVLDYLNSGQPHKAWPLISSLTRAVDYMQLTVDPPLIQSPSLMEPLHLLPSTVDWTENEERRRLFWIIFLFDRFCTVCNGWNTSLTSEDVHQRLPADGYYFTREEQVLTPYFGIWNKSEARIGRSLIHAPAQYRAVDQDMAPVSHRTPRSPTRTAPSNTVDASHLGAFAYCIEATESLCQVVSYFIRQPVNWQSRKDVLDWLTRFKELDLRLVHWKMFLPPKWRDSNIARAGEPINMDPNLTLAHLTHNTSMILLHYPIAYPPSAWTDIVPLPSACSAETCRLASSETLQIVSQFLSTTDIDFVNHQFSFCVYIAAKSLLGGKYQKEVLDSLLDCLREISSRWLRYQPGRSIESLDQAARYAEHVEYLRQRPASEPTFDFFDHTCRMSQPTSRQDSEHSIVPPSRPNTGDPRMNFV